MKNIYFITAIVEHAKDIAKKGFVYKYKLNEK